MNFDTAYRERRVVAWDGYIEVRGNRYSVPGGLCGALVEVRIGLDSDLAVYNGEGQLAARHRLKCAAAGWVLAPEHHHMLWEQALTVERRELAGLAFVERADNLILLGPPRRRQNHVGGGARD